MKTIIAVCPYCRAGGVRAPESAIGASAACPKCGSSFTVMPPDEDSPGWANETEKPPSPETSSPTADTRPATALADDVTEPSPVMTAEASPQTSPDEAPEASEPTDVGMMVALGALILVGPTVLASQLPYGRFIAAGLGVIGLLGGLASLGAEGRARLAGAAAVTLHTLILLVVLLMPGLLNLDPWRTPTDDTPKGPFAVGHGTGERRPLTGNETLDASATSWEFDDVRVTVRSAIGPIELEGPKGTKQTTREPYLRITVRVSNVGYSREIPFSGWAAGHGTDGLHVTDAGGKVLPQATFDSEWSPNAGKALSSATPDESSEITLLFAVPKTETVRLRLAGAAFALPEHEIKFRVALGNSR